MPGKRKWTVKWKGCAKAAFDDGCQLLYSGITVSSPLCRLCGDSLKLNRTQPEPGLQIFIQPCSCKAGANIINLDRFRSIFPEDTAREFYEDLKSRKQRNWTTAGLDVGSKKFFENKYGSDEGAKRFKIKNEKCITTSIAYFENKGLSSEEAIKALRNRQSTRSLDKLFLKYGESGVDKWISTNAMWRKKISKKNVQENYLEPSLISVAEQKAQYMWLVTVLTDLSKRLSDLYAGDGFEIDHCFSRAAGFHLGISPKIICATPNLRVIERGVNLAKKDLCSITQYNLQATYDEFITTSNGKLYNNISETLLNRVGYQWTGW